MPKIAIISDIHGNLPALEAVLEVLDKENPNEWLCLGDLVGYGPNPAECVQIIMERNIPTVLGNHDAGVTGKLTLRHFREPNRKLLGITQTLLSDDLLEWLKQRPYIIHKKGEWIAAHATPLNPDHWQYLDSAVAVRSTLNEIDEELCFVGHTHIPAFVSSEIGGFEFKKGNKHLINPGSVGQPRDNDYRAACCIIDTGEMIYKPIRVEYDLNKTKEALRALGFSRTEVNHMLRF